MEDYNKKYDNLAEQLIELARKERKLSTINVKIAKLLDIVEEINNEYSDLVDTKNEIRRKTALKNKKNIILNTILLIVATCVMFGLANVALSGLFKLLPLICHIIYGGLMGVNVIWEILIGVKDLKNDEKLYDGLEYNEDYLSVLEQIKAKKKEQHEKDLEYTRLIGKQSELELTTKVLRTTINDFSNSTDLDTAVDVALSKGAEEEIQYIQNRGLIRRRLKEEEKN